MTTGQAIDAFAEHLATATNPRTGRLRSPHTRRNYLMACEAVLDRSAPVADLDTPAGAMRLRAAVDTAWGDAAPATHNARLSAVRAALTHWRDRGWLTSDPLDGHAHRAVPQDRPDVIAHAEVARVLANRRHPLRDRALWALLYATAARAQEILALDVADLDLRNRRARVVRKGGAADTVTWSPEAAALLSRHLADRTTGPVFLSDRAAWGAARGRRRTSDLDSATGRGRLGYRQAAALLQRATGWRLHDLRHAALTHAAERGMDTVLLMVKSGHQSIRSLARYARPSVDALQRFEDERRR